MHVFLIKGEHCKHVENVELANGCKPVIEGKELEADRSQEILQVDPAIWYKTFVVKALYIDCNQRCVAWSREELCSDDTKQCRMKKPASIPERVQYLFSDPDIYDFDPTPDELIDEVIVLLGRSVNKSCKGGHNDKGFRNELARILHCYILPAITLGSEDIPELEKALSRIHICLSDVEGEILTRSKSMELLSGTLQKQRDRLIKLEDFDREAYIRSCDKEFLSLFLKHLEKDIRSVSTNLESVQLQINDVKAHGDSNGNLLLQDLRYERDGINKSLESLRVIRENIKNVICRPCYSKRMKKIKVKANVFHTIYMEISDRFQAQRDELQKLAVLKLKISAVRETIRNKLKRLESAIILHHAEMPYLQTEDTVVGLDLFGSDGKPEGWLTLNERVFKLLSDERSGTYQLHLQHCAMLKDKIKAVKDELQMFRARTNSRETLDSCDDMEMKIDIAACVCEGLPQTVEQEARKWQDVPQARDTSMSQACYMHSSALDNHLTRTIDDVKDLIREHMEKMCDLLLDHMPEYSGHQFDKVWISYQTFYSEAMLSSLKDLYSLSVTACCQSLYKEMQRMTVNYIIDDVFLNLLLVQHRRRSDSRRSQTSLRRSSSWEEISVTQAAGRLSLEIKKCTSEELYQLADRECQDMPAHVRCLLEPTGSEASPSEFDTASSYSADSDVGQSEDSSIDFDSEELRAALDPLLTPFFQNLQELFQAQTILDKLRQMTKTCRGLEEELSVILGGRHSGCCDELLSTTLLGLFYLDEQVFVEFYVEIKMLIDLQPPCLKNGAHDYCLTNFFAAFQHLFNLQVLERPRSYDL